MRASAWVQRYATALCAWAWRCVLGLTDWIVDGIIARLGEPMEWEEVERLAQAKMREEARRAEELWRARTRRKPQLRLLEKP